MLLSSTSSEILCLTPVVKWCRLVIKSPLNSFSCNCSAKAACQNGTYPMQNYSVAISATRVKLWLVISHPYAAIESDVLGKHVATNCQRFFSPTPRLCRWAVMLQSFFSCHMLRPIAGTSSLSLGRSNYLTSPKSGLAVIREDGDDAEDEDVLSWMADA